MAVKNQHSDLFLKLKNQLLSINNSVLLNRKKIGEFLEPCNKNDRSMLVQINKQLKAINNKVLINQHTIGTKLVLSGKQFDIAALKNLKRQLKVINRNVLINQNMIARQLVGNKNNTELKKSLKIIFKQLRRINKNVLLNRRIVCRLTQPPPTSCPAGHICIPVRLIAGLSLELDIDPKEPNIKVTLKVFGAPVISGTISLANPTLSIGGEFGLFLAELTLRGEFGDIARGHFRIILSGRACIGPPIEFLRDCTGFNQVIYDQ